MKKIFALLSLIAILTVVFTSQTLANDHTVMVMGIQTKFNVTVDTVNYTAYGVEDVSTNIVSKGSLYIISDTKFERLDLPFEVGWTFKSFIVSKVNFEKFERLDLPFEVGWMN